MIRFSSACVTVTVVAVKLRIEVCAMVVAISCDVPVTFFLFSGSMETVYCVPGVNPVKMVSSPEANACRDWLP